MRSEEIERAKAMSHEVRGQSRHRRVARVLLDAWFALWPVASAWVLWHAITSPGGLLTGQETSWEHIPLGFVAAFILMVLIFGCIVWCCSHVDRRYHRWRKALWYGAILILIPLGCPVYWFHRMRDSVFGRREQANVDRGECPCKRTGLAHRLLTAYLMLHTFMSIVCLLQVAALAVYQLATGKPRVQFSGWLEVATDFEMAILIPLWLLLAGLFSLYVAQKLQRTGARAGTISVGLELFLILTPVYGLKRWRRLSRSPVCTYN